MKSNKYIVRVLLGLLLFFLAAPPVTWPAPFNVNNVTEFQVALTTASANGDNDTINVAPGTYNITATLNYNSSENFSLTVSGDGAGTTVLDGADTIQLLNMSSTGASADITVRGMTFRNGNNILTDYGGGLNIVVASAVIIIEQSVFNDNRANRTPPTSGSGGGVFASSDSGSVILRNNTFTGNSATNDGGGASVWTTNGTILIAETLLPTIPPLLPVAMMPGVLRQCLKMAR